MDDEAASVNGLVLEYLTWAGLNETAEVFRAECKAHNPAPPEDVPEDAQQEEGRENGSRPTSRRYTQELTEEALSHFDAGQGAKFFKIWRELRSNQRQPSLEALTLEFYLHVYFATLPIRHGHREDHPAAMRVFRQFLESCPNAVGAVQDLLPYYALPYVADPTQHPSFVQVFQDPWVHDLRSRLGTWLGRQQNTQLPALFTFLRQQRHNANSVGATLLAQESAATAVRSQRTLRRRLQRLNEDYQKLIGVSWELTQALEAAVRGERVDLETTLAACTHRYPELFSLCLTADTSAGPATILLESMQRCERHPAASAHLPALDFERVRSDLGTAPDTHVLLLLQALRHRITRVTTGTVRHAVVTSYVRGDVLGVRNGSRSWGRISAALVHSHHRLLAQTAARLINALTAFNAGRSYLASEEVSRVLLSALKVEQPDPAATDMALAALQKLSIRDEVQAVLIREGCVEWLVETLGKARTLPPYTQEYAAALLMNLTLRSAGRARCVPLGPTLLPALTHLLATVPAHVIPYVTGALYSLLSHPTLRQEAFDLGLDTTLRRLSQGGSQEQRRQLEYIVGEIQRDPPMSPPPSPDPMLDMEEDPEWLEEELDVDDPVKPPPHAPTGEELLGWRYTVHAEEKTLDSERSTDGRQPRSAPAIPWTPLPSLSLPRPHTDGAAASQLKKRQHQQTPTSSSQWDYPSDPEEKGAHGGGSFSTRSSLSESFCLSSTAAWPRRESTDLEHREAGEEEEDPGRNIWVRGDNNDHLEEEEEDGVVRDWAMSLRSGTGARAPAGASRGQENTGTSDEVVLLTTEAPQGTAAPSAGDEREEQSLLEGQDVKRPPSHTGIQAAQDDEPPYDEGSSSLAPETSSARGLQLLRTTEKRQISLDDHEALVAPTGISTSEKSSEGEENPRDATPPPPPLDLDAAALEEPVGDSAPQNNSKGTNEGNSTGAAAGPPPPTEGIQGTTAEDPSAGVPLEGPCAVKAEEPKINTIDVVASKILEQIVGQSREVPSATSTPDNDPLLRSLPERKVSEYKAAFSSRPRIARTPPRSAAAAKGGHMAPPDAHIRRQSIQRGDASSPRAVLPPISSNNHTYTKAAT
ncbi:lisH domain-containing protein ARMC9-like isoform X2 [Macrobrachium rosenbergii]|uniref:lisH domain-containing protein ARMC9-like isoform X2 n=1 Tax=Macrobrachium rosenbergii TaxID=79674 RepID=UPI0034D4980F